MPAIPMTTQPFLVGMDVVYTRSDGPRNLGKMHMPSNHQAHDHLQDEPLPTTVGYLSCHTFCQVVQPSTYLLAQSIASDLWPPFALVFS